MGQWNGSTWQGEWLGAWLGGGDDPASTGLIAQGSGTATFTAVVTLRHIDAPTGGQSESGRAQRIHAQNQALIAALTAMAASGALSQ